MKITTIKYEQLFPTGEYANQRLSIEMQMEAEYHNEETRSLGVTNAFQEAKRLVNEAFQKITGEVDGGNLGWKGPFPHDNGIPDMRTEKQIPEEQRRLNAIADIEKCTELDGPNGLLTFRFASTQNATVKAAYDLQMIKLSKK